MKLSDMKQSDLYEAAAAELEKRKWSRESLWRDKKGKPTHNKVMVHSCCAWGASLLVHNTLDIYAFQDIHGVSIIRFNDKIARDKRQVIRALRKTAKELRKQGR